MYYWDRSSSPTFDMEFDTGGRDEEIMDQSASVGGGIKGIFRRLLLLALAAAN